MKLLAQGAKALQFELQDGESAILGRAPEAQFRIEWDPKISRMHVQVVRAGNRLQIRKCSRAKNPIRVQGKDVESAELSDGDTFTLGETEFRVCAGDESTLDDGAFGEHSFSHEQLQQFSFSHADRQLQALAKLPERLTGVGGDESLAVELVRLLLDGLPRANAASVMAFANPSAPDVTNPLMMRWESPKVEMSRFRPSQRLIQRTFESGQSKLHIWEKDLSRSQEYTVLENEWAFCIPISGEACRGWCLYVSGSKSATLQSTEPLTDKDFAGDLRFAELVAEFIGAVRRVHQLEWQRTGLDPFVPEVVKEAVNRTTLTGTVTGSDFEQFELLRPRETDISILFCDVRGFSRKTEQAQQQLHEILQRVTLAVSVMTRSIDRYKGIIADLQGDAALGFWGWPEPAGDGPLPACRAALAIQADFQRASANKENQLSDFKVGIGIAHGRAIAGKIGTAEQAKIDVFGPVVNQGSRLEGMTKQLRVPILIDEATAEWVRKSMPRSEGRCRRLGRVRPVGMDTSISVSELLPPATTAGTLTDENIADYELAVDHVMSGDWSSALEVLDRLPVTDRAKDFLMVYIAQNNYEPPRDWDGVIEMTRK
jgi:adenylate cyclase